MFVDDEDLDAKRARLGAASASSGHAAAASGAPQHHPPAQPGQHVQHVHETVNTDGMSEG
eukprot:5822926-Pyramimonas_sp.AAC.1